MDKIGLLMELKKMGEDEHLASQKEITETIDAIIVILKGYYCDCIMNHILDDDTSYYAPEYNSWLEYLMELEQGVCFQKVLKENFTEDYIEDLWQRSHIANRMSEKEIKEEISLHIGQLKMLCMLGKMGLKNEKDIMLMEKEKANIVGLYHLLCE